MVLRPAFRFIEIGTVWIARCAAVPCRSPVWPLECSTYLPMPLKTYIQRAGANGWRVSLFSGAQLHLRCDHVGCPSCHLVDLDQPGEMRGERRRPHRTVAQILGQRRAPVPQGHLAGECARTAHLQVKQRLHYVRYGSILSADNAYPISASRVDIEETPNSPVTFTGSNNPSLS